VIVENSVGETIWLKILKTQRMEGRFSNVNIRAKPFKRSVTSLVQAIVFVVLIGSYIFIAAGMDRAVVRGFVLSTCVDRCCRCNLEN